MATNDRKSAEEETNPPALNTDREIWRRVPHDYYSPRIFVTKGGGIGIDVGGYCIVKPVEEWHKAVERVSVLERALRELLATEWIVSRGWGGPYDWERRDKAIAEAEAALGETERNTL